MSVCVCVYVSVCLCLWLQSLKYTALHAAADHGRLNVVKVLVEHNADLHAQRTVRGLQTPAVPRRPSPSTLDTFSSLPARRVVTLVPILAQFHLETPLHFAAASGHADVVEFLLSVGADRLRFDREGRRPLELALQFRRQRCVELLGGAFVFLRRVFSWCLLFCISRQLHTHRSAGRRRKAVLRRVHAYVNDVEVAVPVR